MCACVHNRAKNGTHVCAPLKKELNSTTAISNSLVEVSSPFQSPAYCFLKFPLLSLTQNVPLPCRLSSAHSCKHQCVQRGRLDSCRRLGCSTGLCIHHERLIGREN